MGFLDICTDIYVIGHGDGLSTETSILFAVYLSEVRGRDAIYVNYEEICPKWFEDIPNVKKHGNGMYIARNLTYTYLNCKSYSVNDYSLRIWDIGSKWICNENILKEEILKNHIGAEINSGKLLIITGSLKPWNKDKLYACTEMLYRNSIHKIAVIDGEHTHYKNAYSRQYNISSVLLPGDRKPFTVRNREFMFFNEIDNLLDNISRNNFR